MHDEFTHLLLINTHLNIRYKKHTCNSSKVGECTTRINIEVDGYTRVPTLDQGDIHSWVFNLLGRRCKAKNIQIMENDSKVLLGHTDYLHAPQTCMQCKVQRRYQVFQIFFVLVVTVYILTDLLYPREFYCNNDSDDSIKADIGALKLQIQMLEKNLRDAVVSSNIQRPVQKASSDKTSISENGEKKTRITKRATSGKTPKPNRKQKKNIVVHVEGRGGLNGNLDQHHDNFAGTYTKWKYAEWYSRLVKGQKQQFNLNFNAGRLRVKTSGLYMVYAQITMIGNTKHGFFVRKRDKNQGNRTLCSCYKNIEIHNNSSADDLMSCSTFGIFELMARDEIYIQHNSHQGTKALFDADASYFGLYKIANIHNRKGRKKSLS